MSTYRFVCWEHQSYLPSSFNRIPVLSHCCSLMCIDIDFRHRIIIRFFYVIENLYLKFLSPETSKKSDNLNLVLDLFPQERKTMCYAFSEFYNSVCIWAYIRFLFGPTFTTIFFPQNKMVHSLICWQAKM